MIQGITLLLNFLLLIGVSLSEPHMYEKYSECVCVYIYSNRTSCCNFLYIVLVTKMATARQL